MRGTLLTTALGLGAALVIFTPAQAAQECPRTFQGRSGAMNCFCQPQAITGTVWGSGTYTEDSSICGAAFHAGAVPRNGGMVTLQGTQGCPSYAGTVSNGYSSTPYGPWRASFFFPGITNGSCAGARPAPSAGPAGDGNFASKSSGPATVPNCPAAFTAFRGRGGQLTCFCPQGSFNGEVWGSRIYTEDSAICRAAIHAGVVGPQGGPVTMAGAAGCSFYTASVSNGVTTKPYGPWNSSFYFTAAPPTASCR